jgi:hypothetical protein
MGGLRTLPGCRRAVNFCLWTARLGVAPYALDPADVDRLWEESLRMIG